MSDIFQNAKKIDELRSTALRLAKDRDRSPEDHEKWKQACAAWTGQYDQLAFPGGLAAHMEQLEAGNPLAGEMAIRYLESDPRYFRSGYHKADMLKLLRTARFDAEQRKRLQAVILSRVRGKPVREFRWYAKLAPAITDNEFEWRLGEIAKSAPDSAKRQARWVLEHIGQAKSVAKKRQ